MANIIKDDLEKDSVQIHYYLFRPDTLLKTIGDYTYMYNFTLQEWNLTKPLSEYIALGIDFKVLSEEIAKTLVEESYDDISIKREIENEEIQELISGKKKLNEDNKKRKDILPELFKNSDIKGLNIRTKGDDALNKILIVLIVIAIICIIELILRII